MKRKKIPFARGVGGLSPPFYTKDDRINVEEIKRYVDWLIEKGCRMIVPGSQCNWLNDDERRLLWETYVDAARNRAAVMPYLGYVSRSTKGFLQEIKMAEEVGANSLYFSIKTVAECNGIPWPSVEWPKEYEEAVYQFLKAGFEATDLPVLLYNNQLHWKMPNIPVDFMVKLANEFENFAVLKTNASTSFAPPYGQLPYAVRALKPLGVNIIKGERDAECAIALLLGCDGLMPPLGHAFPDKFTDVYNAVQAGDLKKAFRIQNDFLDFDKIEQAHPGAYFGTKIYVLEALGFEVGKPRPPQIPLSEACRKQVDNILKKWGVYKKYTYHNW